MDIAWSKAQLADLPVHGGVRQRGMEMTRLETFCDAAFAFAVTMLVVGGGSIPQSYADLVLMLKGIPAFAGSFVVIAGFWWSHRTWSRRYGLEDGTSTLISLCFVFVMLLYIYPLKMVFSAFAGWATGGWLPTDFVMRDPRDMLGIFIVYGAGFAVQTSLLVLLNLRALKAAEALALNPVERLRTRQEIVQNSVLAASGLVSALWALTLPAQMGVYAGFVYMLLPVAMPLLSARYGRRIRDMLADEAG